MVGRDRIITPIHHHYHHLNMARIAIEGSRDDLQTIRDVLNAIEEDDVDELELEITTTTDTGNDEATGNLESTTNSAQNKAATDGGTAATNPGPTPGHTHDRDHSVAFNERNLAEQVLQIIRDSDDKPEVSEIVSQIPNTGKSSVSTQAHRLFHRGHLTRDGEGGRGDPYRYYLTEKGERELERFENGETRIPTADPKKRY